MKKWRCSYAYLGRKSFTLVGWEEKGLAAARLENPSSWERGWQVAHVSSGLKIVAAPTLRDARRYLQALLPLANWFQSNKALSRNRDLYLRVRDTLKALDTGAV